MRFELHLNNLLETTKLSPDDRDTTLGGVGFGHIPTLSPTFDVLTDRISAKGFQLRAAGWIVKLAPTLGYPRTAPGVDGLLLPARAHLSLRSDHLTELASRSRKEALALVQEVGEMAAAIFSLLTLRRTPWIHAEAVVARGGRGEHRRFWAPAIVQTGSGRRPCLTYEGQFKNAVGPALRTLLRLRAKSSNAADTLVEAMFLFASAAEDGDLRRSWSSLSLCFDLLGGRRELRATRSRREIQRLRAVRRELASLLAIAQAKPASDATLRHLRYGLQNLDRVTYREGMEAVARKARVDVTPLGGADLLRDIVDIRNGLMHRGSLSNRKLRDIQKRGAKRGLGFPPGELSRQRVGLQLMYERHDTALRLAAQLLLRILRVPDRFVPRVWDWRSASGPF
ncbi:MAG: hypothetical protein VYE22_29735 [Myxococcota bacterium]|nr:hypothetical protein [Myxococcota bacterium]